MADRRPQRITSERPADHWAFLTVRDRVVLDAGCGMWAGLPYPEATPLFFAAAGAARVLGADYDPSSFPGIVSEARSAGVGGLIHLRKRQVTTPDCWRWLLHGWGGYEPTVVKCDVEGAEVHLDGLSASDVAAVDEWAVEYHGAEAREIVLRALLRWGYAVRLVEIGGYPAERVGVFHATGGC